jgi:cell division protein FtsQ
MKVSTPAPHRLTRLLGSMLLVSVLLATTAVLVSMNRPIRVVRIEAELSIDEQQQVRGAIDSLVGQGMLTLDLDEVVATMRQLAWPRLVSARREWPDELVVQLVKETFVARWGDLGALNSAGEVFPGVELAADVPMLRADLAGGPRAMQVFQLLHGALGSSGPSIVVLEQTRSGEWQVEVDDGFRVALGREDLAARLGRFLAVHREVLVDRAAEVEWVDARYMNGVAVRWRDAGQGPAALAWAH